MRLPQHPMAPVSDEQIPEGEDWGYQLKWDGVRILAVVEEGNVQLYSRKLLYKNAIFPEVVRMLSTLKGRYLLDGEVVMFDTVKQRPNFQKVLQRERSKQIVRIEQLNPEQHICYVLFDLLHYGQEDWTGKPYIERHRKLSSLFPEKKPHLFVTDLFPDGKTLWQWVKQNHWEGVISKRLSSPYREGKKHQDWLKKKTAIIENVSIIGLTIRGGHAASLVMLREGLFFGKVSLGLNTASKQQLLALGKTREAKGSPFKQLPAELKGEQILWLTQPFACEVTGLEVTSAGLLRHPKISKLIIE